MDIKALDRNIQSCKSYFSPLSTNINKNGRGYRLLDGSINALKVISYLTVLIPITVGIVWGISQGLKGRIKPLDNKNHPATQAAAPILGAKKQAPKLPPPDWNKMRQNLAPISEAGVSHITKSELEQTLNVLEANWADIGKFGQWNEKQQVLHLRKGALPRSVEIHKTDDGVQIYVLHKGTKQGVKTPKLGTGGFKEVARSVNLETLKPYVHATIDIGKKIAPEEEIRTLTMNECVVQSLFQNDDEIVHLAGWTEYTSKNGSQKFAITLEQCNGGEIFYACFDREHGTGKILNENLDDLLRVVTDLIKMLEILEREEVVNRDIKPENVFLNVDANGHVHAKMGDFGLAWTQEEAQAKVESEPEVLTGTPDYYPPEYADRYGDNQEERWAFTTHTWQIGMVLHYLLTQNIPYSTPPLSGMKFYPKFNPFNINNDSQPNIQKGLNEKLIDGSIYIPNCLNGHPDLIKCLKGIVFDMLQIDPKKRPSPEELLKRLEPFR